MKFTILTTFFLITILHTTIAADAKKNATEEIIDPFEADIDLRWAADTFCRLYTESSPRARKVVFPYKKNCHFWWQCTTYQLQKKECQGAAYNINLHYDLYLDRCEEPSIAKCSFQFDEEEIIMEEIMQYYKKTEE